MVVISDGIELFIDERVHRVRVHQMSAMDEMPEVASDGVDEEHLAVLIPIMAPRVGGAMREYLDDLFLGVITPDAAFHWHTLIVRRAGNAELAGARVTAATVEPAIRAKAQAVGEVVVVVLRNREAIEHDFGFAIRNVVIVAIRNEQHLRRAHEPHTAATDFDAGEHLHVFREHFARLGHSIPIFILKNDDTILQTEIETLRALSVSVVFRHPHATTRIPSHADRILHIRFSSKDRGLEASGQFESLQSLLWRHG